MVVKNDGKNGGIDELWVENEIGFGWISLGWWRSRRCWGATISPVLGCDSSMLRCAIGALTGAWMCNQSSCCFSLSLFYFPGMEINCGENTSVKYFTGFWGMIYSQWKFRDNPNTPSGVKYFPETIYCRNKHSLNLKLLNSRSNTSTLLSPC